MTFCLGLIRKPASDPSRFQRVLESQVYSLNGAYEMTP